MSAPAPIVSQNGIIHVLAYTPTEGERGVPITVRIHIHPDLADAMYVRLVIANKAVPTKVTQLSNVTYGRWQLRAAAPPFDPLQFPSTKVLISVQALNEENAILDSVTFGHFSYWAQHTLDRRSSTASISKLPRLQIPESATLRRRSNQNLPTPSPTGSERSPFPKSPQRKTTRLHRRMKSGSLCRTKQGPKNEEDELYAQTPILDLVTPLSSICAGWSTAEISGGRRLVRFSKVQDGRRLIVSCEPILQDDYVESDTVISCIYREEVDSCYVTSVDVIYLLERLTNGEFPVEEKNRIRRNLEGLRPTTVSKHKPGFGEFFQRIMEFPDPKPRNIEKDLKVFEWNLLAQALEKILSKYSIYSSGPDSTDSSQSTTPVTSESPELYALQLSYPSQEESGLSRFLDQQMSAAKLEPLPENAIIPSLPEMSKDLGDPEHGFPSPTDSTSSPSSPSSAYPLFATEPGTVEGGEPHHKEASVWGSGSQEYKPDDLGLDHFTTLGSYEVVEPVHGSNFVDGPNLDFTFGYDNNYTFNGLSDEALVTLGDQYI